MVEAGVHAILKGEAVALLEVAKKQRHVVEGDESFGANLEGVRSFVGAHETVDALRRLKRSGDSPDVGHTHDTFDVGLVLDALRRLLQCAAGERGNRIDERRRAALGPQVFESVRKVTYVADRHVEAGGSFAAPDCSLVAPLPSLVAFAVSLVPRFDETGEAIDEASGANRAECKAEGIAEERLRFVAFKPQDVADKLDPFDGTAVFAQDGHLALQAKLKRHHPHDAHHEAVQRADQREMLTRDDLAKHRSKVATRQGAAKALGFRLRFMIVGGSIREALYEAVEYLASRKSRER